MVQQQTFPNAMDLIVREIKAIFAHRVVNTVGLLLPVAPAASHDARQLHVVNDARLTGTITHDSKMSCLVSCYLLCDRGSMSLFVSKLFLRVPSTEFITDVVLYEYREAMTDVVDC
jgi:hypothetical protein